MRRGDLVTVALAGDFGKPRPALVIQSDLFDTDTLTVLLLSSTIVDTPLIRIMVQPTPSNALNSPSQIMIDKAMTLKREKIGRVFGSIEDETLIAVNRSLAVFFGLA
ncbi:type II toxin-antitoxin system PemK/MazF family toxin [Neorhizobium sp. T6_25]|jgi:mRNA interferase MazF|uniref:type II toxin-antitoxin system PemK/MazF family toxin n=1 Tax=Neorhizobium sp. T6_25 TaxID=2093833 RepID=UPI000CF87A77|nr:type II toxin-antitoxin system PemK/MazF family toxin [Neorhizobium sp. T6_25]